MKQDLNLEKVLMQQNFLFNLGIPFTRVEATGTINGTNATFQAPSPYYPFFPTGEANITPTVDNLVAELLLEGTPNTYTVAEIASIGSIVDPLTGETVLGSAVLTTPPIADDADHVVLSGSEQIEPMVCQGLDPKPKQDEKKVGRLATTDMLYGYGSIELTMKLDMVTSNSSIDLMKKIFHQTYTGDDDVEAGYDASEWVPTPKQLFGSILIDDPVTGDIIGFYKMQQCRAKPDMPNIKDGAEGKFTLEMSVQKTPVLLTPTV